MKEEKSIKERNDGRKEFMERENMKKDQRKLYERKKGQDVKK